MLAEERFSLIMEQLNRKRTVTVQELCEALSTSESTIRRDLNELDRMGKVNKVHGGATLPDSQFLADEPTMAAKEALAVVQKKCIAKAAAALITAEDFVFLDAGSTTLALVRELNGPALDARYVTNGVAHARLLAQKGCKVFLVGGLLRPETEAIIGAAALHSLQQYNFTKAFLGANGVALDAQTLTLALGAQQKLTATVLAPAAPENTAVTWASADMDVAAVFADGTVLGKKAGTTTVTATTVDGGFTASCTVTVKPAPDGVMPVRLDSVCARPGNTVQVRLMLDENPGFANLSLVIGYDADVMTLTKVENKVSGTEYTGSQTLTADPYMLTWNSVRDCTASGTLAILTFQIKNTAAYGVYPISVSFYKGLQGTYKDGVNVNYDQSRNALPLVYVGSSAEIRSYIPGDINGDGHVDSRDVLNLLRHLSGWKGITVVEEALDVNGDRESDFRDVTALLQYIAGWDVVLH